MSSLGSRRRGTGRTRSDLPMNADINVTSLVDVAFTLLIIFIITMPIFQGGIEVAIPRADVDTLTPEEAPLIVSTTRDSRVFVEDNEVDVASVESTVRQLLATGAFNQVWIRGDSLAPHGLTVKVVAGAQQAGVPFAFIAERPPRR